MYLLPYLILSPDFNHIELLKIFYTEIFPCKELAKWLTYDESIIKCKLCFLFVVLDPKSMKNREFSFTFSNGSYLRFQSFEDSDQLKSFLIKNTPVKIDLGAIYSAKVIQFFINSCFHVTFIIAERTKAC